MPNTSDPAEWDAYIAAAPNYTEAGARIEAAANAGVDFAELIRHQQERTS